jgi:hypothetical protein
LRWAPAILPDCCELTAEDSSDDFDKPMRETAAEKGQIGEESGSLEGRQAVRHFNR